MMKVIILLHLILLHGVFCVNFTILANLQIDVNTDMRVGTILQQSVDYYNQYPIIPGVTLNLQLLNSLESETVCVDNIINAARVDLSHEIVGVIGETYSSNTKGMALASAAFNFLQCSGSATNIDLSDKSTYSTFFRTAPSDEFQAPALANFVHLMKWTKVGILASNDAYGLGLAQGFVARAIEGHLNITVLANIPYTSGTSDFKAVATQMKKSNARIILFMGYDDIIYYLQEAKRQGMVGENYVYIGGDGVFLAYDVLAAGYPIKFNDEDYENIAGTIAITPNDIGENFIFADMYQRYLDGYVKANNLDDHGLPQYAANFFDCFLALNYGIKKFLDANQLTPAEYIKLPRNERISLDFMVNEVTFEGSLGNFQLKSNGDPSSSLYRVANFLKNKAFVTIGNLNEVTADIMMAKPPIFFDGTTNVPFDSPIFVEIKISYADNGPIALVVLFCFGLVATIGTGVMIFIRRGSPPFHEFSLYQLGATLFGLIFSWISIFAFVGELNQIMCSLQQIFLWIGFNVFISSLVISLIQKYLIFDNKVLAQKISYDPLKFGKGRKKSDFSMILFALFIILNITFIGIWLGLDLPTPKKLEDSLTNTFYYQCESPEFWETSWGLGQLKLDNKFVKLMDGTDNFEKLFLENPSLKPISVGFVFNWVLVIYNGLLTLLALILSQNVKSIATECADNQWINTLCQQLFAILSLAVIILNVIDDYMAEFYIRTLIIFTVNCLILFMVCSRLLLPQSSKVDSIHGSTIAVKKHSKKMLKFEIVGKQIGTLLSQWKKYTLLIINQEYVLLSVLSPLTKENESSGIAIKSKAIIVHHDEHENGDILDPTTTFKVEIPGRGLKKNIAMLLQCDNEATKVTLKNNIEGRFPLINGGLESNASFGGTSSQRLGGTSSQINLGSGQLNVSSELPKSHSKILANRSNDCLQITHTVGKSASKSHDVINR